METHNVPKMLLKVFRMRGKIDLTPAYQRGKVWSRDKKQLLLDSIFRKFYIPPVFLRILDGDYYECVDGQQRLTTIFDFFDNNISFSKKFTPDYGGQTFEQLPRNVKDIFEDHEIVIVEINRCSDEEIRIMFDRLQRGMPLTAGERLNAKFGNMHNFISEISQHPFLKNINIRDYRGAFHQISAQMTCLELYGLSDVKFRNLENMYDYYKTFDNNSKEAQQIKKILNFLLKAFPNLTPELHTRAGIVSLYLLTSELLKDYSIKDKENLIHDFMIDFENNLIMAEEAGSDVELLKYLSAISHSSDGANSIKTRHEIIRKYFFLFATELEPLDSSRGFTEAQKIAIFRKDNGICRICREKVEWNHFHADHIIPYCRGGKTSVGNGQVLCPKDNLQKGANLVS
jgi:hypothetical protein